MEEIMSVRMFTREEYETILKKIPVKEIISAKVSYRVINDLKVPEGWRNSNEFVKEKLLFYRKSDADVMCPPVSILDFPCIRRDCNNVAEIYIRTNKYEYTITSTCIRISGPDMPFTPDELISEGVGLGRGSFFYMWQPAQRT